MPGEYKPGEEKELSGSYSFLKAFVEEHTTPGLRGKLALPIIADWGPVGEFVTVKNKAEALLHFGAVEDFDLIYAAEPKPSEVLLWRAAGASAKAASAVLKSATDTDSLQVDAFYKGSDGNRIRIVVQPDILDETKTEILVYFDAEMVASYVGTSNDDFVQINTTSKLVKITKMSDDIPAASAGVNLTAGDSGRTVEATAYTAYLSALETKRGKFGVFTLGITDPALNAAAQQWTDEQVLEGNYIRFVSGGDDTRDQNKEQTAQASLDANHLAVHNVGAGIEWNGKQYPSSKVAVYMAALISAMPLNYTMALFITPFDRVTKEWGKTDLIDLVKAGTLMLTMDNDKVIIQEPVNTLTKPSADQSEEFGKIRVVDTLFTIRMAEEELGKAWVRSQPNSNNQIRRLAFARRVLDEVFKPLADLEVIEPDYEYIEDPQYHGEDAVFKPARNAGYFIAAFKHLDALEKIYSYNQSK